MPKSLGKRERKKRLKELRQRERERQARAAALKKVGGIIVLVLIIAGLGYGGYRWLLGVKVYPPTDFGSHTEAVPSGHILTEPMPLGTQAHMLEHADGGGPPGVIINYNCEDFPCDSDLIDRLTQIAQEYSSFVYLAPFPDMDAKIALTHVGKLETLDELDEEQIQAFIERSPK
ncbi:MAG: DUF3105 domain-containing protein [Anaerolineae bacterium]